MLINNKSCKQSITKLNADNIIQIAKYLPYRSKLLEKINLEIFTEETANTFLFISPDRDTYHIGLGLPWITNKQVIVQISQLSSKEHQILRFELVRRRTKRRP